MDSNLHLDSKLPVDLQPRRKCPSECPEYCERTPSCAPHSMQTKSLPNLRKIHWQPPTNGAVLMETCSRGSSPVLPALTPHRCRGGGAFPRTSLFAHRERDLLREAASNLSDFFLRFHFQGLKSLPRAERRLGGFFSGGGERRGPTPPRPARVPSPAARTIPFVLPPPLFAVKRKSKILPTKFFFLFLINSKFFLLIF